MIILIDLVQLVIHETLEKIGVIIDNFLGHVQYVTFVCFKRKKQCDMMLRLYNYVRQFKPVLLQKVPEMLSVVGVAV